MNRFQLLVVLGLLALFVGFLLYLDGLQPPSAAPDDSRIPGPSASANRKTPRAVQGGGRTAAESTDRLPHRANGDPASLPPAGFASSRQCQACHPAIYGEWEADEHASSWTEENFVTYTEQYRQVECLSCHAPKPMLEMGIGREPQLRQEQRAEGVSCLSCHLRGGKTHGTLGSGAPCGGVLEPELKTSQACFHCHSAHNLFKEYLASEQYRQGLRCQDCHMRALERPVAAGGPPRKTRSHRIHAGGHDPEALRTVLTMDLEIQGEELKITVSNVGAAHGVPGEINNRIVRLEVSVLTPRSGAAGSSAGGEYDEVDAYEYLFRAPPRKARNIIPSTQVLPGQPKVLRYPLPAGRGKVLAKLQYKLEPFLLNDQAVPMVQKELAFGGEKR